MLDGERLVWAAATIALTTAFGVTLVITRLRSNGRDQHETRLAANVLALGLLVVVLVAVAFVAGYATLERQTEYMVIAVSVLGIGVVLYNDATRPHRAGATEVRSGGAGESAGAHDSASAPHPASEAFPQCAPDALHLRTRRTGSGVEPFVLGDDPVVRAAAARAEACVTTSHYDEPFTCDEAGEDAAPREVGTELRPYTLGVRFGRIPRT